MTFEETAYSIRARLAGVVFIGMQESRNGNAMPLFNDPLTHATFTLEDGENIGAALARKRKQWEEQ